MPNTHNGLLTLAVAGKPLSVWVEQIWEVLRATEQQFDSGHRCDHIDRVLNMALRLAQVENANLMVIVPAAMLHDCVSVAKNSSERSKASQFAAERAAEILSALQYSDDAELIVAIKHAIAAHSFSANIKPQTLEAKIIQDADRLDALGAIGIARVMMVGALHGNQIYDIDAPFPKTGSRPLEDKRFIIDHFYTKLLNLVDTFHTKSAAAEAARRTEYMCGYLEQLAAEIV